MYIQPEIIVVVTAFAVLGMEMFLPPRQRVLQTPVCLLGLSIALAAVVYLMIQGDGNFLGGQFLFDGVAGWFKVSFLLAGLLTVLLSADLLNGRFKIVPGQNRVLIHRGEFYTVVLFNLVGSMFLISATNLINLYVCLELATIPLFALVAWRRDDPLSCEAGLKYIILGATSSAVVLFGLGLLYGLSGSVDLFTMGDNLSFGPATKLAIAMVVVGVGFKLTLVPFHMWAADVYRGAPLPVAAYLSVASKAAGLAFMFQLFYRVLGNVLLDVSMALAVLAAVTMTLGNLVAVVQANVKRFMAFSAISQAGYLIMGFLDPSGAPSMVYYMLVYVVTNMVVFGVLVFYLNETGREEIEDYRGLSRTNPWIALVMMLGLFSLAGIPPLSGFVGKFFLFSVASKAGFHWLVAVAAVNSTISLYYYLRIVRQMYIEPGLGDDPPIRASASIVTALAVSTVLMVVLGIVPFFYETIYEQTHNWIAVAGIRGGMAE
ncbi:NADH-quinone oxidoreductase subunit N [Stieleria sp. ICT_E10.1]|uniref:NADH-quinone oxidoreductase subunit N n=1 Tax=Stieleria sedimenti TaxID=2976331 RepID=UPI00217F59ED|nr:NADH-quinone oxidoreductase subunit N [Stieleria sedimenti]MCS7470131.1 NADH-quinone oxidoreductase subunit N [Stieleria sedimenti]